MRAAKLALFFSAAAVWPLAAQGPAFDTSGNSKLYGTYYFRHVIYVVDSNADQNGYVGDINEGIGVYGTIAFDGNGNYTINNGTVADSYDFQNSGIANRVAILFYRTSACPTSTPVPGTYCDLVQRLRFYDECGDGRSGLRVVRSERRFHRQQHGDHTGV